MYITVDNDQVSIFSSDIDHQHVALVERGLSDEIKNAVSELYDVGLITPKAILRAIEKKGLPVPCITKLRNFLSLLRKEKFGSSSINLNDLKKMVPRTKRNSSRSRHSFYSAIRSRC